MTKRTSPGGWDHKFKMRTEPLSKHGEGQTKRRHQRPTCARHIPETPAPVVVLSHSHPQDPMSLRSHA